MNSRQAYRIAYAAMVLALVVACTPSAEETAPAPAAGETSALTPPADTSTGPTAPNTADTLATAPSEPAAPGAATAPAAATPEELASGRAAFARTCAMCHGAKGEGTPAAAAIAARDVAVIANKITKGPINPGDRMPAMAAMMSGDEVDDVAKFVAAGLPQ